MAPVRSHGGAAKGRAQERGTQHYAIETNASRASAPPPRLTPVGSETNQDMQGGSNSTSRGTYSVPNPGNHTAVEDPQVIPGRAINGVPPQPRDHPNPRQLRADVLQLEVRVCIEDLESTFRIIRESAARQAEARGARGGRQDAYVEPREERREPEEMPSQAEEVLLEPEVPPQLEMVLPELDGAHAAHNIAPHEANNPMIQQNNAPNHPVVVPAEVRPAQGDAPSNAPDHANRACAIRHATKNVTKLTRNSRMHKTDPGGRHRERRLGEAGGWLKRLVRGLIKWVAGTLDRYRVWCPQNPQPGRHRRDWVLERVGGKKEPKHKKKRKW